MNSLKRVILITGTPCVGKTTISSLLSLKLNATHIDVGKLVEKEGLTKGTDRLRGTLIADLDRLSKRILEIIEKTKGDIIIDGHYVTEVVPKENIFKVFVLRKNPEELKKLMEAKGFKNRKLWENLAAEILDICLFNAIKMCGLDKVCEIDTSGKSPGEVVEEILSVLDNKLKCQVGIVDWLGKLEREGRLEDFLKDF